MSPIRLSLQWYWRRVIYNKFKKLFCSCGSFLKTHQNDWKFISKQLWACVTWILYRLKERKTLSKESKRPAPHVGFLSIHLLMLSTKNMLVLSTACVAFRSKANLWVEQWHLDCWKRWIVWSSWAFSIPWNLCCHHWLLSAKHSKLVQWISLELNQTWRKRKVSCRTLPLNKLH